MTDRDLNFNNFVASICNKAEELLREAHRFQCWLQTPDELKAQADFYERESKLYLKRAEKFRDESNKKNIG